jgi:AraC-like DNA-binding protein
MPLATINPLSAIPVASMKDCTYGARTSDESISAASGVLVPSRRRGALLHRLCSSSGARRSGRLEGSGVGAYEGRARRLPCRLAAAAGLERRTLLRRFTNATGRSPIEYCRAVRIARARELLEGGDISQKQIAESIGYMDVASFARIFRKAVGLAPGAYRRRFGRTGISPSDLPAKLRPSQRKRMFEPGLRA